MIFKINFSRGTFVFQTDINQQQRLHLLYTYFFKFIIKKYYLDTKKRIILYICKLNKNKINYRVNL